jgi:branched-chain amino acid transport system ATP-binding protein
MPVSEPLLSLRAVSAGYFKKRVIHDVEFTLSRGDIVAILGANGSGKSTLFKTILGLVDQREGEIAFQSKDLFYVPTHQIVHQGIAYLLQDRNVFGGLTVEDNLRLSGLGERKHRSFQNDLFEFFPEIGDGLTRRVGLLSGGERQMLAIMMTLMRTPVLGLLDEPSAGLSPQLVSRVMATIQVLGKRYGVAFLIIEQNIRAVLDISSRVFIMKNGRLDRRQDYQNILLQDKLKEVFFL